ncbi:MAG: anti-sigma factor family protein [Oryzihumus sp.]
MSTDAFAEYDAAYVLGALSPEDRRDYEAHVATCDDCARAVRELAGMPGLLARVPREEVESTPPEVPPTLLPRLAREVRRDRVRRRWVLGGAGAAAAALLAVAVAGGVAQVGTPSTTPAPVGTAMSQVAATPLHASARLVGVAWGTRIELTCTYDTRYYGNPNASYALVVVDRTGHAEQVATWAAVPGKVSQVTAASATRSADIARVEVRTAAGTPVLTLAS